MLILMIIFNVVTHLWINVSMVSFSQLELVYLNFLIIASLLFKNVRKCTPFIRINDSQLFSLGFNPDPCLQPLTLRVSRKLSLTNVNYRFTRILFMQGSHLWKWLYPRRWTDSFENISLRSNYTIGNL